MALAVAMVACSGAVGKTGEPGPKGEPGDTAPPVPPANLAPQARALELPAVNLMEDGAAHTVNVAANFFDTDAAEGETLTLAYSVSVEGVVGLTLTDGMLTISPVAPGSTVITVTATDADGLSVSATINVMVVDEGAPMYVMGSLTTGTALTYGDDLVIPGTEIASAFVGDGLSFGAAESGDPVVVVVMDPDNNTVTITARNANGKADVTITATDEDGETASHTIEILVRETIVPAASGTPDAVTLAVGGESDDVDVSTLFSNPMVGDLTYTAESSVPGVATVAVDGSTVTITPEGEGSAMVKVTADNGYGTAMQTISVTVAPTPPTAVAGGIPDVTLPIGGQRNRGLTPYFTPGEFGSQDLTYTASVTTSIPTGAVTTRVSGSDLIIDAHMAGSATITVTATDGEGETAMQTVMVTVEAKEVVDPPTPNMPPQYKPGKTLTNMAPIQLVDGHDDGTVPDTLVPADNTNGTDKEYRAAAEDNKNINLDDYFQDPDGVDSRMTYAVTMTETPKDAEKKPVIHLHPVAATLTSAPEATTEIPDTGASGDAPDGEDEAERMLVIEPRNLGTATITITVRDENGVTATFPFMVEVVSSGTNSPPVIGQTAGVDSITGTVFPDLVGAPDATENKRLKIGETRKVIDDELISTLFNDPDLDNSDRPNEMLTLSVKYFPVGALAAIEGPAINTNTMKELAADKVGVAAMPITATWDGSSRAKITLRLTGTKGTPIGDVDGEDDDGHLVALIATDEYGVSFAHVLRVIVNHVPKAEGDQATASPKADPKKLGDAVVMCDPDTTAADDEVDCMKLGFDTVTAASNTWYVALAEDMAGYFHDPDGAENVLECRINGTTGTSTGTGDNAKPGFKFSLHDGSDAAPRTLRIQAVNLSTYPATGSVRIACVDQWDSSSPEATLKVGVTHQSVSRH